MLTNMANMDEVGIAQRCAGGMNLGGTMCHLVPHSDMNLWGTMCNLVPHSDMNLWGTAHSQNH